MFCVIILYLVTYVFHYFCHGCYTRSRPYACKIITNNSRILWGLSQYKVAAFRWVPSCPPGFLEGLPSRLLGGSVVASQEVPCLEASHAGDITWADLDMSMSTYSGPMLVLWWIVKLNCDQDDYVKTDITPWNPITHEPIPKATCVQVAEIMSLDRENDSSFALISLIGWDDSKGGLHSLIHLFVFNPWAIFHQELCVGTYVRVDEVLLAD